MKQKELFDLVGVAGGEGVSPEVEKAKLWCCLWILAGSRFVGSKRLLSGLPY